MRFTKNLSLIFSTLFLFWLFSITALACTCYGTLPCEAYTRANQVFIGKLQKLEKVENSNIAEVYAYFAVERIFKGDFKKEIIVKYETRCRPEPFVIGETYFVYDDSGQMNNICNLTRIFSKKNSKNDSDLKYAESLSADKPQFTISGRLDELSESELKETFIEINDGEKSHRISPAKYGLFNFLGYKQNTYNIKITVPFLAEVFPGYQASYPNFTTTKLKTQTSVDYKLNYQPNGCSYTELIFNKLP